MAQGLNRAERNRLRELLVDHFSDSELRDLCLDLGVRYQDLPGDTKRDRVRELIALHEHGDRLTELLAVCRLSRPSLDWPHPPQRESSSAQVLYMASQSKKERSRSRVRLPLWGMALLVLVGIVFLIGSSIWLFRTVQAEVSDFRVVDPEFNDVVEPQPGTAVVPGMPVISEEGNPGQLFTGEVLKPWSGDERISFLLLGVDQRCDEDGPTHTDSMMLATVDPVSLSASILSLPRDLWVEIPGFGVDRINQAYYMGQVHEYPGGGQALARETVEAAIGVEIDYYIAIDFNAFIEFVDHIGGIKMDVPETIDDTDYPDSCYGYDPFYIEAGTQQLDGATALKYARTRATFGGDVDRAGRQQAVMMAAREQVMQLDMIPQLITQAPQMWQTLQDNVRTNLSLDEIIQLALLTQKIPGESIRTAVIDYDYVYNETTPDGRQVLVPVREEIRKLRDELFAPPPIPTPVIENLPTLTADEDARVAVYNGTPVFGLAAATQEYLLANDINVTQIGNADSATYRTTQIIDYGSHPNTTFQLVQLMGIPPLNISSGSNPDGDYDILLILGEDWQLPNE